MTNTNTKFLKSKKMKKVVNVLMALLFFAGAIFIVKNASDFQASVMPTKSAPAYDGLTLPILQSPVWTSLTKTEYTATYDQIPQGKLQALPIYDANQLKTSTESLGWKSSSDLSIRNSKITYPVAYMGNYKLDGVEYAGSHLAVDIKVPKGTPVYSIGNGVVVKVANLTTGFGKHIVVRHDNFPSFDDPSRKVTYFSCYDHLSEIDTTEGSIVTKGQLIGKAGDTGTATTPHLHFQIDNDQAPWHPYWPFTSQDSAAAGLSFTDSINAGLGKDKALATTINPMMYIQKYMKDVVTNDNNSSTNNNNSNSVVIPVETNTGSTSNNNNVTTNNTPSTTTNTTTPSTNVPSNDTTTNSNTSPSNTTSSNSNSNTPTVSEKPAVAFKVTTDETVKAEVPSMATIKAVDSDGNIVKSYKPASGLYFNITLGAADFDQSASSVTFTDGVAVVQFTPKTTYGLQFVVSDKLISGTSKIIQNEVQASAVTNASNNNNNGNLSDVAADSVNYKAISFLKNHNVISGYPDGTFKPQSVVSRVEAVKFLMAGSNTDLQQNSTLPFKDTKATQWYTDYVATAYSKDIVQGYPDKTFKPANTVNRAEFFKMLAQAFDIKFNPYVTRDVYNDVPSSSWYAAYVKMAKDKNLIDVRGHYFDPETGMTREEVAQAIYRAIMIKVTGADSYSDSLVASGSDLTSFFN